MIQGTQDDLSTKENTEELIKHLPSSDEESLKIWKLFEIPKWNHHTLYIAKEPKLLFD